MLISVKATLCSRTFSSLLLISHPKLTLMSKVSLSSVNPAGHLWLNSSPSTTILSKSDALSIERQILAHCQGNHCILLYSPFEILVLRWINTSVLFASKLIRKNVPSFAHIKFKTMEVQTKKEGLHFFTMKAEHIVNVVGTSLMSMVALVNSSIVSFLWSLSSEKSRTHVPAPALQSRTKMDEKKKKHMTFLQSHVNVTLTGIMKWGDQGLIELQMHSYKIWSDLWIHRHTDMIINTSWTNQAKWILIKFWPVDRLY